MYKYCTNISFAIFYILHYNIFKVYFLNLQDDVYFKMMTLNIRNMIIAQITTPTHGKWTSHFPYTHSRGKICFPVDFCKTLFFYLWRYVLMAMKSRNSLFSANCLVLSDSNHEINFIASFLVTMKHWFFLTWKNDRSMDKIWIDDNKMLSQD